MSAKYALRSILVLCVIVLLSTLVVTSAAAAKELAFYDPIRTSPPGQTLQGGSPVPGGPGFISITAFAFHPYNSSVILQYDNTKLYNGGSNLGVYMAPVNLPHGATITKVVVFYHDTIAANNLSLSLYRVNMFDGSAEEVAYAYPITSSGDGFIEAAIYYPGVNNQLYSYMIHLVIPNGYNQNLSLISVRIDYDFPVYLPTIQK